MSSFKFINNFDSILPRFISENSSFKVKYLALMNTVLPQFYTLMMTMTFFMSSDHESVSMVNTMLVVVYMILVLGFVVWVRYLKNMNKELYGKISRTQDYVDLDREQEPLVGYGSVNNHGDVDLGRDLNMNSGSIDIPVETNIPGFDSDPLGSI